MSRLSNRQSFAPVRGFVVGYLIFAIGLMMALTAIAARTMDLYGSGKELGKYEDSLRDQASLIRGKVLACTVAYPGGDNGLGFRLPFPAAPASTLVSDMTCPGAPSGSNSLWNGTDGVFLPPVPIGYTPWHVAHDSASLRISTSATDHSPAHTAALQNIAAHTTGASYSSATYTLTVVLAQ